MNATAMPGKKPAGKKPKTEQAAEPTYGYGIRTWNRDGTAYNDFQWDLTPGARNTASDFNARPICGYGLHANPDGWGDWSLLGLASDNGHEKIVGIVRWDKALEVSIDDGQKVKAPWMEVVMTSREAPMSSIYGFITEKWRERLQAVLRAEGTQGVSTTGDYAHAASTGDYAHAASTGNGAHAASTGNGAHAASTGDYAHAASTGDYAHAASTGNGAHAASTGNGAHAASTGNGAHAASTGNGAHAASTGNGAHAASTGNGAHAASTGNGAHAASTGDYAHAASTGDYAHAASTGNGAHAASTGNGAHAASTGNGAHAASTGNGAHAASTGDYAHAASTGDYAHAASTGDYAHAASTGDYAHAASTGQSAIACAIGPEGRAQSADTGAIVLARYERVAYNYDGKDFQLRDVFAGMVGKVYGEVTIKPNTWYVLGAEGPEEVQ